MYKIVKVRVNDDKDRDYLRLFVNLFNFNTELCDIENDDTFVLICVDNYRGCVSNITSSAYSQDLYVGLKDIIEHLYDCKDILLNR